MIIKGLVEEDFVNYKKPSMFITFPTCSFKCEKDCGMRVCQNSALADAPNINIAVDDLVDRYLSNPITAAIVCGGMEPFESWYDLLHLIENLRTKTDDDIVIYTGFKEEEISYAVDCLSIFPNIIIKFGRFIPNQQPRYDEILEVNLASDNQYARRIS